MYVCFVGGSGGDMGGITSGSCVKLICDTLTWSVKNRQSNSRHKDVTILIKSDQRSTLINFSSYEISCQYRACFIRIKCECELSRILKGQEIQHHTVFFWKSRGLTQ